LARATHGRADDLLTATLLTARCPVLFAPAMHTEMWQHPATVENVATLRRRGAVVLEPASGRLTGEDSGAGRLPEAEEITTFAQLLLDRHDAMPYDLAGVRLLVTAGGTREPIDPVRFIGNRSSGKQGYALARVAAQRGADPGARSGPRGGRQAGALAALPGLRLQSGGGPPVGKNRLRAVGRRRAPVPGVPFVMSASETFDVIVIGFGYAGAVAAIVTRLACSPVTVDMTGGSLSVAWEPGEQIRMRGAATHVFEGELDLDALP